MRRINLPGAITAVLPEAEPHRAVLCCFPGGGMTRRYFDMAGASFAEAMAAQGFISIAFDHPGVGESEIPADPYGLTARVVAEAGVAAVARVRRLLRQGALDPALPPMPDAVVVGVGHSMGAMIVTMMQAVAAPFRALALIGFSTRGLPEVLSDDEKRVAAQAVREDADYVRLARARFGTALADIPEREGGSDALKAAAGKLLTVSAMQSMLPRNIMAEAARVDVPLLLAVGDRDIAGRPEAIAPAFTSAPRTTLIVLPDAGHHPFIAPSAHQFYAALAAFAGDVAAPT